MTKEEKIKSLLKAMKQGYAGRYIFTEEAPDELVDLFLNKYNVRDLEYEVFSEACDLLVEIYDDEANEDSSNFVEDAIDDRTMSIGSVYTADRLAYLNVWNEYAISELMRGYDLESIADACAMWYGQAVNSAAYVIKEWIEEEEMTEDDIEDDATAGGR